VYMPVIQSFIFGRSRSCCIVGAPSRARLSPGVDIRVCMNRGGGYAARVHGDPGRYNPGNCVHGAIGHCIHLIRRISCGRGRGLRETPPSRSCRHRRGRDGTRRMGYIQESRVQEHDWTSPPTWTSRNGKTFGGTQQKIGRYCGQMVPVTRAGTFRR